MKQNLNNFLKAQNDKKYATQSGTKIHIILKNIVIGSASGDIGDQDIIEKIKQNPELTQYFTSSAQTEVPIAGFINGIFISRRIDRLLINHSAKTVAFIDYKSDTDKQIFIEKYKKQLNEYAQLLKSAYPGYKTSGFILWLHDWQLEQII